MDHLILVDAHVHLHSCFDLDSFIEGAYANFNQAARRIGPAKGCVGVLLFTEGPRENGFERLLEQIEQQRTGNDSALGTWRAHPAEEEMSLYLTDGPHKALVVVAGRQVVSREGLEVLALGTRRSFEPKTSLEALIRMVAHEGALPVIPWGFGKWTGARGKLLRHLMQAPGLPRFFLGDSANRPAVLSRSPMFRIAEERGIGDLPGSDPLPFPRENRRAGRCGFWVTSSLDRQYPSRDIKRILLHPEVSIQPYGIQETPLRFLHNQLAMQFRKLSSR